MICAHFLANSTVGLEESWMRPWPVKLFELMQNLVHTIAVQGRKLYLGGFMKNTFHIGLHSDAYGPIPSKAGVMIDLTSLYSLIPV